MNEQELNNNDMDTLSNVARSAYEKNTTYAEYIRWIIVVKSIITALSSPPAKEAEKNHKNQNHE